MVDLWTGLVTRRPRHRTMHSDGGNLKGERKGKVKRMDGWEFHISIFPVFENSQLFHWFI